MLMIESCNVSLLPYTMQVGDVEEDTVEQEVPKRLQQTQ